MSAHVHAPNMALYAQDAAESDKPWEMWEGWSGCRWNRLDVNPPWDEFAQYRRRERTIAVNGIEIPEPVRVPLNDGDNYFLPDIFGCDRVYEIPNQWNGTDAELGWLARGMIHLTHAAARQHAIAMLVPSRSPNAVAPCDPACEAQ